MKNRPTKYKPGSLSTITRRWIGSLLSSSKTGRSIHEKSGRNPVHQMTLPTSRTRSSSSMGRPSRTPTTRGTRSTLAAARSLGLIRTCGAPRAREPRAEPAADGSVHHQDVVTDQPEQQVLEDVPCHE